MFQVPSEKMITLQGLGHFLGYIYALAVLGRVVSQQTVWCSGTPTGRCGVHHDSMNMLLYLYMYNKVASRLVIV